MNLRDYQAEACKSACEAWDAGAKRVLLTLATGLGKTIIFAKLAELFVSGGRGRVLVIAPSIELVGQAADKISRVTGESCAIEQASNWSNEELHMRSDYVVSCKASLVSRMRDGRKRYERLKDIGLIVIDEAHGAATPDYREIVEHFGCPTLGVTATPKRHDGVRMGELFDSAPFVMGVKEGVDEGWLVAPRTTCVQLNHLDLSKVGTNRGDFVASQLGAAMEDDEVVFEVAEAVIQESGDLKTLVFTASVDQAMKVAQVLKNRGMPADWVCGDKSKCPDSKRVEVLKDFKTPGGIQTIVNVGVLTTGFDFPGLQHIVMGRPTKSETLFTQILGRGTRALDGVVDFADSTAETRREAIDASGKPHWKFTDLRDVSMAHKLVTPIDVLGGDYTIDERERAKQLAAEADSDRDIGELLEEAREHIAAEEARERSRLAKLKAEASYTRVEVDPFDAAFELVSHQAPAKPRNDYAMPYGQHAGKPISEVPRGYLVYMHREGKLRSRRYPWLERVVKKQLGVKEGAVA